MKTNKENFEKRLYNTPQIERIKLDNEISLVLESDVSPMGDPSWVKNQESFSNDPFKTTIC